MLTCFSLSTACDVRSETDASKLERGPEFTVQPESVIYDRDTIHPLLQIECVATGNPEPVYRWYNIFEQSKEEVDPQRVTVTFSYIQNNYVKELLDGVYKL